MQVAKSVNSLAIEQERADLLKRLLAFRGRLPPGFKFDRDEATAR